MGRVADDIEQLRVIEDDRRRHAEAERTERNHPKGWEAGVEFRGDAGILSTGPRTSPGSPSNNEWTELLDIWDLDPEVYEIDPNYNPEFRAWDSNLGGGDVQRFYYYKARIRLRARYYGLDISELLTGIGRHKKTKRSLLLTDQPVDLVACLSDWQVGKGDGDGVVGTIDRIMTSFDRIVDFIADLRKMGVEIGCLYLIGMGDLVEQCWGNYPAQPFLVELNRREQMRLTRRCLRDGAIMLSKHVPMMVFGGVGGNHGENRGGSSSSGGKAKAFTSPGDNDDVAVFEMVAEALSMNDEAFGHIKYVIPDEELSIVLDIGGVITGFHHGHLCTRGGTPEQKVWNWWTGQMAGNRPVGDAHLLFTGHYHHLNIKNYGPRSWLQCPAQDGGSTWWENSTGAHSSPGALVCTVGEGQGNELGYDFLRIL